MYFKLLILCFISFPVFSQRWDSLPGKFQNAGAAGILYSDSNYLYAAGRYYLIGREHFKGIARWNGIRWDSMGAGIDGLDTLDSFPENTLVITLYQNELYVGGVFGSLGKINTPCIGRWGGIAWDSLQIQPFKNHFTAAVMALTVINSDLYMGGTFDTVAGFPCIGIAKWNDTNWSSLNFPNLISFQVIRSICEYHGSVYAAGEFYGDTITDSLKHILRYDSVGWHPVGPGIKGNADIINSMVVYNGELYVAGYFSKSEGNVGNNIQRWNGTQWHDVGGGTDFEIFQVFVFSSKLYAVGQLTTAGGIPASKIAEWDGAKWCSLGSTFDNSIFSGAVYKDTLYIGGGFWTIDGDSISYLAKWLGGDYTDTCGNDATVINETKVESGGLKVYPNPNNGIFTIAFSHPADIAGSQTTIEIYNVLGQQVYSATLNQVQGDNLIDLCKQPNGVYLYRVLSENGELAGQGKVVVEK